MELNASIYIDVRRQPALAKFMHIVAMTSPASLHTTTTVPKTKNLEPLAVDERVTPLLEQGAEADRLAAMGPDLLGIS